MTFLHFWHVCDVKNVNTNAKYMLFCSEISFVAIYALFLRNLSCLDLRTFCVEKNLFKNCVGGENITNMRSGQY